MRLFAPLTPIALAAGLALALPAQAAVLGGASLDLTDGVYLTDLQVDGLVVLVGGNFFAQSLITDLDLRRAYRISLFLELNDTVFLDTTFDAGVLSINELLALPPVQTGLGILAPVFATDDGVLDVLGQDVFFSYDITGSDADSVSGLFLLTTTFADGAIGFGLDGLPGEGTFALSLAIAPVPLPASLPLLLAGLGLLGWMARRRA